MHIGFYSPYLDSLGGGERYVLSLASHWSKQHAVDVFWDEINIVKKAEERFNIDMSNIKVVQNIFRGKNLFKKLLISHQYDLIFFLTDGSIPSTFAKNNILHFQVPFTHLPLTPWKLSRYRNIVCNSQFTKNHIDVRLRDKAIVIYPPVHAIPSVKTMKKERMVLSVGRFSETKKQSVLIDVFRTAQEKPTFGQWKLVFAGSLLESEREYFLKLKKSASDMRVEFFPNINQMELNQLYRKAMLYWHAAGFGETGPERMEHFGITTVEAMSAGCIVCTYNGGGQPEIIEDGINGFLWSTIEELLQTTTEVLNKPALQTAIRNQAAKTPEKFSEEKFFQSFDALLT